MSFVLHVTPEAHDQSRKANCLLFPWQNIKYDSYWKECLYFSITENQTEFTQQTTMGNEI